MRNRIVCIFLSCAVLGACKKSSKDKPNPLGSTYPVALNAIITPTILAALQSHGATVHDGLTPPVINGIYLLSPNYCVFDNSGDNAAGTVFNPYKLRFANQNNGTHTISFDYKSVLDATDYGADNSATYITGTGNAFTVFAQSTGVETGISNVLLDVISGTVQNGNVQNLQLSLYLVSKGADPAGLIEAVGSTRIFNDQDEVSETQSTFSFVKQTALHTTGNHRSVLSQSNDR